MDQALLQRLASQAEELERQGLLKVERVIASPQQASVRLADGREAINLCANNYLGLANHPRLRAAGQSRVTKLVLIK